MDIDFSDVLEVCLDAIALKILGVVLIVTMLIFYFFFWPEISSRDSTRRAAKSAKGGSSRVYTDFWGGEIQVEKEVGKEAIVYTAVSAGKDKKARTFDDIIVTEVDLNKSALVGGWVAQKSKETAKGFFSGLFKKSEFQNENR